MSDQLETEAVEHNSIEDIELPGEPAEEGKARILDRIKKLPKKKVIIGVCCVAALACAAGMGIHKIHSGKKDDAEIETVRAERKTIVRSVDGSSTVEANDSYNVTALTTGEIISDTFNEGDTVTKDQVLYTIDSSDAQKKVDTAKNALAKSQQAYLDAIKKRVNTVASNDVNTKTTKNEIAKAVESVSTAQRNLSTAQQGVSDLTIVSDISGTVSEVLVKEGDSVNDGTKLATVYDDTKLKLKIPFNKNDAENISEGDYAVVTVASGNDSIGGYVEDVPSSTTATDAHAIVKYITIVMDNPGGLKAGVSASATVGGAACSDIAKLENYKEGSITAKAQGRVSSLWFDENDRVYSGQTLGYLTSDNANNTLANAKSSLSGSEIDLDNAYIKLEKLVIDNDTYALDSSVKTAQIDLDNARISLEEAQENLEDYEITAPIDGTIITKNKKSGDKLEQNQNSSSEPMAVIYDMSVLKIQLNVDESEIRDVQVGQVVRITADAVDGEFKGSVSKVGVNGTSENGVTVYPVDIEVTEYGDLLPGMNVDCIIDVESAENVLAVPAQAIQRGNRVYIRGDKTEENDKAPEGFCSVKVETGASDGTFVEIKSGLNGDEEIYSGTKASGVEAEGAAEQQQMQGGMQGGMGGPPGGSMPGGGGGMSGGGQRGGGGMGGAPR